MAETYKNTKKVDLIINDYKREYIILNRKEVDYQYNEIIKVKTYSFKTVSQFKY